ncbi:MAG: hypothetical protein IPF92_29235 [Myxococcales bacterium]|jgi:hypothetical protein|nr:hypothetical protein [Myxococcales bacterium]MBL0196762.1 hypothetical protein [Myxococcales bacterium]HQY60529.1 hypothetical protein [Polyangiaceae bacterium]
MTSTARRPAPAPPSRDLRQRPVKREVERERDLLAESGMVPVAVTHDIRVPPARRPVRLLSVAAATVSSVTLCVFGWHNVQPGVLSWVFASLEAALHAVRAMRNAVEWVVVEGSQAIVDLARLDGVLAKSP